MAWIESHQELGRHPKTKRLARAAGISIPAAIGHLHLLWWWAMDFAQDGDLTNYTDEDIADATFWDGSAHEFISALVESGFIDGMKENRKIHDWWEYAGRLIDKREQNRERMKRARAAKAAAQEERENSQAGTFRARSEHNNAPNTTTVPNPTVPNPTVPNPTVPNPTVPNPTVPQRPSSVRPSKENEDGLTELLACIFGDKNIPSIWTDSIRETITEMYTAPDIVVRGASISQEKVRERLRGLSGESIKWAVEKMVGAGDVKVPKAYLMSCLYNAPAEYDLEISLQVQRDSLDVGNSRGHPGD